MTGVISLCHSCQAQREWESMPRQARHDTFGQMGRSMVEMLGVLAIMGIVGMVGVKMYNMAMNKHHANTLIEQAQRRAVSAASQINLMGHAPSLADFLENTFSGGTFGGVTQEGLHKQFGIQVSNVPKAVCQNILNAIGDNTSLRRLSRTAIADTAMTSCDGTNTFWMIYNNDLKGAGGDTEYASGDCGCQTVCGVCVNQGGQNMCVNECPMSATQCTQNAQCSGTCVGCVIPENETQGTCQACQRVEYLESTGTQYINTGRTLTDYSIIEVEGQSTDITQKDRVLCGNGNSVNSDDRVQVHFGMNNANSLTCRIDGSMSGSVSIGTNKFMVKLDIPARKGYINNNLVIDNYSNNINKTVSFTLFCRHIKTGYNNYAKAKIYSFKMYENSNAILDFIPVHAPFKEAGKQNCMFDRVSGELFCNAATGDDFLIP